MNNTHIKLAMAPYGYAYSIPYQLGYLKSSLNKNNISSSCIDLNIDFYHRFELNNETLQNEKYARSNKFADVNNWNNEKNFYDKLYNDLKSTIRNYAETLLADSPVFIGFSIFNTNRLFTIELAKAIKKINKKTTILFGGPDCTSNFNNSNNEVYQKIITNEIADYVIIGEGETTLPELLTSLSLKKDIKHINGILYKKKRKLFNIFNKNSDQSFFTGKQNFIENINTIPFPDYSDFDLDKYPYAALPLAFNRGCNNRCAFCDIKLIWKNSYKIRTAKNITDEIFHLSTITNKKYIFFHGAYINTDKKLLDEIADILIGRWQDTPQLEWEGWARINNNLSPATLKKIHHAGCRRLVFGFESGSPKVIQDMKKGFSHKIAKEVIKNCSLNKIKITLFIIVGFPTESEDDFQMTLDFISENAEYIDTCYCMSEFILSDEMAINYKKYNISPQSRDHFKWETTDGNTFPVRKKRLQRFYSHLNKLNINCC